MCKCLLVIGSMFFGVQMFACRQFQVSWCANVCLSVVPSVLVCIRVLLSGSMCFGVQVFAHHWFQMFWCANVCLLVVPGVLVCKCLFVNGSRCVVDHIHICLLAVLVCK